MVICRQMTRGLITATVSGIVAGERASLWQFPPTPLGAPDPLLTQLSGSLVIAECTLGLGTSRRASWKIAPEPLGTETGDMFGKLKMCGREGEKPCPSRVGGWHLDAEDPQDWCGKKWGRKLGDNVDEGRGVY